jgi:hypothetical protein
LTINTLRLALSAWQFTPTLYIEMGGARRDQVATATAGGHYSDTVSEPKPVCQEDNIAHSSCHATYLGLNHFACNTSDYTAIKAAGA